MLTWQQAEDMAAGRATSAIKNAIRPSSHPDRVASVEGYYELRMLGLNVYRADGQTLIWRGTASGSISTDAASGDLNSAVQAILAAFPPR